MKFERRNLSQYDINSAWKKSGGLIFDSKPYGIAYCPKQWCKMTSAVMDAASYGNHSDASWVVDHIVPLAQGGANDYYNYQAMHNYCNSCKGDAR